MQRKRGVATACLSALMAVAAGSASAQTAHAGPKNPDLREPATMSSVVVTATTATRSEADAPASVAVIEGESLRRRPVNDLGDAVRNSVGINLDSVGLGRRGISIRGMSSEHTLILIDGQRINSSASAIAHSDFELGWVPTEALERVEIVRGPMSSLYGSEALGGVVNMITRSATDQWRGSVSAQALVNDHGLDGNQYKTGFYLGGPLVPGKLGLNAWGEYRYRDALRTANNPALTALDEQRATTGHVGLSWTPDTQQRIDASVTAGDEEQKGYRGGTTGPIYSAENDVQRRRYALSHSGNWDWGTSQLRLYRSTLERISRRSDGADTTSPNRFTDTVLDGRVSFAAGPSHKLTLGAETRRERLEDPNVTRAGKKSQNHFALFAQDEILLGERWELVLGGRFDRHEDFGWEASPRAYLLFHATNELIVKGGIGRGFKAPSLKQLSPEYESRAAMGGRGIIRGNPDLEPETNRSLELGATFNRGTLSASGTLFRNDVRNLIETVRRPVCDVPGLVCLDYANIAQVRLQGVELTAGVDLSRQWRVETNYTYLDARDIDNNKRLADRSRHRANVTVVWTATDRFSTRLQAEYTSAQYRSATLRDRPGYTQLHWYADYAFDKHLSLFAGVENLTDKRLANDDATLYGRADEGRRYFAGLTARF